MGRNTAFACAVLLVGCGGPEAPAAPGGIGGTAGAGAAGGGGVAGVAGGGSSGAAGSGGAGVGGATGGLSAGGAPAAGMGGSAFAGGSSGAAGSSGAGGAGMAGAAGRNPLADDLLAHVELDCPTEIIDDEKILCALSITDGLGGIVYSDHAGVELRGRSSLSFPKLNYSVELRTAADMETAVNVLGMGQESDWVLDGMWADRSFVRNALAYDSFRDFSATSYAARGRYATLTLNGDPQGLYRVVERIKRDDDRVNVTADDGMGSSFIVKQDSEGQLRMPLGLQSRWALVYPGDATATEAQRTAVQAWLDRLNDALTGDAPEDATTGVLSLLALDPVADFILLQELMKNIDAFDLSIHIARDAGGLARLVPWDCDLSLGQPTVSDEPNGGPNQETNDQPEGWVIHRPPFIDTLVAVETLRSRLAPRWRELRSTALSDAALARKLDRYATTLTPAAIEENFALWPIEDVDYVDLYEPYSFYDVASHAEEMTRVKAFLTARLAWIDANIEAYPN
jgi:hypothetical protein